ncbi:hypothetical protein VNO78_08390 [Psophocarpus tetragonolobus]|uniref:Uncharacterized protein n=1 Tax=Psophocarpus tetragonolobus TaxID=3891 RepID=A0AAN9SUR1_PSOTE
MGGADLVKVSPRISQMLLRRMVEESSYEVKHLCSQIIDRFQRSDCSSVFGESLNSIRSEREEESVIGFGSDLVSGEGSIVAEIVSSGAIPIRVLGMFQIAQPGQVNPAGGNMVDQGS